MSSKIRQSLLARLAAERETHGDHPVIVAPETLGRAAAERWMSDASLVQLERAFVRCGAGAAGPPSLPGSGNLARRLYRVLHGPGDDGDDPREFFRDLLDDPDGYDLAARPGFADGFLGHLAKVRDALRGCPAAR